MRLLVLLLVTACSGNRWAGVGEWRWLFVRNGAADTAVVSLASTQSDKVLVLRVAPGDSACAKIPFFDALATGAVQIGPAMEVFQRPITHPGMDWLLLAAAPNAPPAFASCLYLSQR